MLESARRQAEVERRAELERLREALEEAERQAEAEAEAAEAERRRQEADERLAEQQRRLAEERRRELIKECFDPMGRELKPARKSGAAETQRRGINGNPRNPIRHAPRR